MITIFKIFYFILLLTKNVNTFKFKNNNFGTIQYQYLYYQNTKIYGKKKKR